MSAEDYLSINAGGDDNAIIIDDSEMEITKNGLLTQECVPVEQNAQASCDDHYVTRLGYENEDVLNMRETGVSQMNHSTSKLRASNNLEQMEFVYLHKRHQFAGMKAKESEYEDGSVIYEYDPDYECGSVVSESSYAGDQQKTLMEVLNYCQAMYDAIQKLDKKFDSLHQKVSEMQHARLKPVLFKPRPVGFTWRSSNNLAPGKIRVQKPAERGSSLQASSHAHGCHSLPVKVRLQRANVQATSTAAPALHTLQCEAQQSVQRQSPPLPTIVSTHSLCPPFSMTSKMPDIPSQSTANVATAVNEGDAPVASLAITSPVVSPAVPIVPTANLEGNAVTITCKASPGSSNMCSELLSSSVSIHPGAASIHSKHTFSTVSDVSDLPSQASLAATVTDSPHAASSAVSFPIVSSAIPPENSMERNNTTVSYSTSAGTTSISSEMPSSSVNPNFEFVGDPKRNVKVLGNYLMKARQKTRPKYAARYLVRVLFPKETLLCSVMGVRARGRRTLDLNKVAAIREFLAMYFPNYDLSEYGRDWKTCITNVNAMIRFLRYETKTSSEPAAGKEKPHDTPDTSMCVDLVDNDEEDEVHSQTTQKVASSTSNQIQNSSWDNSPQIFHAPSSSERQSLEPMASLGNPLRNVQLPFSVIYVAKQKSRPELSARYLIRHLFTEDVLVKSNVYGNMERGTYPLDCNKINALRDFLQENYPSFDLKETGYDWKACVAAINSTIRSLRYDHKRASSGVRSRASAALPLLSLTSKRPPENVL